MKRFFSLLIAVIFLAVVVLTNNRFVLYYEEPFTFNETLKEERRKDKKK